MDFSKLSHQFLNSHFDNISVDPTEYAREMRRLHLKVMPVDFILQLLEEVKGVFAREPVMLDIEGPVIVVGDLHGHILDLYRIMRKFDAPPSTKFLFLGDIVDRGDFSLETITLVFMLKLLYPDSVYIIRGNHEFKNTAEFGGFRSELEAVYPKSTVFQAFIDTFSMLPIAAKMGRVLCIHGGISPDFESLDQLNAIRKPIKTYDDPILCGIFWSDPTFTTRWFVPSRRGTGFLFGESVFADFLRNNDLQMVVRGHECIMKGYEFAFNKKLVTVFSASNYCGKTNNPSGVLRVSDNGSVSAITFPPLPYMKRDSVAFEVVDCAAASLRTSLSQIRTVQLERPILVSSPSLAVFGYKEDFHEFISANSKIKYQRRSRETCLPPLWN